MKETIKCQSIISTKVDNMLKHRHNKKNRISTIVNVPVHLNDLTN